MSRRAFARFAAPAAFLAAITIAVLLVRSGLETGKHRPGRTTTVSTTLARTTKHHGKKKTRHTAHTYTVQSGDTFSSIARKTGTSVARLEQLNPHVDPTTLRVGQKIRVK